MKIAKLRDQIVAVGDTIEDNELVQISLNGFRPSWHNFVPSIYGQEKPTWVQALVGWFQWRGDETIACKMKMPSFRFVYICFKGTPG